MRRPQIFLFIIFAFVLPGCATLMTELTTQWDINPLALERALSSPIPEDMKSEAQETDHEILSQYRVVTNPSVTGRVEKIVSKLVRVSHKRDLHPIIRVLDSEEINAFVTGGEYVYVYKGLLDAVESDDELAGILAHELAHLDAGHITRREMSGLWTNLALLAADKWTKGETADEIIEAAAALIPPAYSREHEREADILGVIYAHRAGYNPIRLVDFFNKTWKQEEEQQLEAEGYLRDVYNEMTETCNEYQAYNQTHQIYGTPETYADAVNAHNNCVNAQQQFEEAKSKYNDFVSGSSPLFRSHPVDSERITIVLGVGEYLQGKRSLDSLAEAPTIQKVVDTLQKVEDGETSQLHSEHRQ